MKLKDFFETDTGEIVAHCLVAAVLALLIKWRVGPSYVELLLDLLVIVGFVARELWQHDWKFSNMGIQSWKEWMFPAAIVMVIYAV